MPWDSVYQEPIRYAADDGVYHMRIVENLLLGGHFPKKIYFDSFTYFPYGTYIHFAPLYDYLLAGVIWIASLGQPTLELIDKIAPLYPAVLGGLTVIIIFFIGKALWGSWAGLFSAFLMALSQPFLFRSLLGATDHHQAETLFSSLAVLFLILAFKTQGKRNFWLWTILAGIGLGLYFLTWIGALLFLFIIFISIILYYLIEFLSGRSQNWILILGSIIFLITLAMISPFFGHPDLLHSPLYNVIHLGVLLLGIFVFLFVLWLGIFLKKKKIDKIYFPGLLVLAGLAILFILGIAFPPLFQGIIESFKTINVGLTSQQGVVEWRGAARESIGEMHPLSIQGAFSSFGCLFYLAFIALGFIIYNLIKKRKPEDLLIVLWFLVIVSITGVLISAIGQNRFNYYLAVLVSLLSGFLAVKGISFGIKGLKKCWQERKIKIYPYRLVGSILVIFNIIFLVFYPFPLNLIDSFPNNLPKIVGNAIGTALTSAGGREEDLYKTLKWLRESTPDPGLDYYALYEEPKFNPETGKIDLYSYPETAYGIMSSWDMGHVITYYSHRLPNANPFQQGLGRGGQITVPGETTFFIENDEQKAIEFLDNLKTKYIITDYGSALGYGAFYGKTKWAFGGEGGYYLEEGGEIATTRKYDKAMIVRLHFFDGREWKYQEIEESYVKYLDHFRLVYESESVSAPGFFENPEKDNIKLMKIFEYVKGAKIVGSAPNGTKVEISTKIKTNQGREFTYQKSLVAKDGVFESVVPYSNNPYKLKIGKIEKEINVSEEDILEGNEIIL